MSLITHKNIPLVSKHQRPIIVDFIYAEGSTAQPIVLFCHGYKGFKDWGPWPLMCQAIAKEGYFVVAINFSHNGGTIQEPIDFPDLEAFGNDNFSKHQDDLQSVIDEVTASNFKFKTIVNSKQLTLIGHSRGGGAAILKTANEAKVTQLITLASINTYDTSFLKGEALEQWKKEGVWYITNGRTQQKMPHYIQFYEDYEQHKEALNIQKAAQDINVAHLLVHGTEDTSVSIKSAETIKKCNPKAITYYPKTDHVFNGKHPWESNTMPKALEDLTTQIIRFLA